MLVIVRPSANAFVPPDSYSCFFNMNEGLDGENLGFQSAHDSLESTQEKKKIQVVQLTQHSPVNVVHSRAQRSSTSRVLEHPALAV